MKDLKKEKLTRAQMKNIMGGTVDLCEATGMFNCSCNGHSFCVSSVSNCAILCGVKPPQAL
jgi:hypothetical protein